MAVGGPGPVAGREDLFAGWWQLIGALGGVPRALVWEGKARSARGGAALELTEQCQAFRGTLGTRVIVCRPANPEVTLAGEKDVLGLWAGTEGQGAKFWMSVLTDLKNRGIRDVLFVVCDGSATPSG